VRIVSARSRDLGVATEMLLTKGEQESEDGVPRRITPAASTVVPQPLMPRVLCWRSQGRAAGALGHAAPACVSAGWVELTTRRLEHSWRDETMQLVVLDARRLGGIANHFAECRDQAFVLEALLLL
jgi:hypothetical protein